MSIESVDLLHGLIKRGWSINKRTGQITLMRPVAASRPIRLSRQGESIDLEDIELEMFILLAMASGWGGYPFVWGQKFPDEPSRVIARTIREHLAKFAIPADAQSELERAASLRLAAFLERGAFTPHILDRTDRSAD
jgi:hypothetical protein